MKIVQCSFHSYSSSNLKLSNNQEQRARVWSGLPFISAFHCFFSHQPLFIVNWLGQCSANFRFIRINLKKSKKTGTVTESNQTKTRKSKNKARKNIQGKVPHDGVKWSSLQGTLKLPFWFSKEIRINTKTLFWALKISWLSMAFSENLSSTP